MCKNKGNRLKTLLIFQLALREFLMRALIHNRTALFPIVALLVAAMALVGYCAAIAAGTPAVVESASKDSVVKLRIKPDTHDFGKVVVSLDSTPLTVTVTNESKSMSAAGVSTSISIDFTSIVAVAPFSILSDGCSGSPLAAGSSCEVEVVFTPTTTGKVKIKKGLVFADSAKKSPQSVELEGKGIPGPTPSATATPPGITPTPTISATPTITGTPATPTCTIRATSTVISTITPSATPSPAPQAGDVLFAGGDTGGTLGSNPIASGANSTNGAQVYNANTSAFDAVGSLKTDREAAAAVLMENNKVLVVGGEQCFAASFGGASGFECSALNTAEIYDPTTKAFTPAGSGSCGTMTTARAGASATLINKTSGATYLNGRILIVGGASGSSFQSASAPLAGSGAPTGQVAQNSAEIYDPASDTFTPLAASVPVPSTCGASGTSPCGLVNHAAALIGAFGTSPTDQGQVLIAGGDLVSPLYESTNLAFIFHPNTQTFTTAASMNTARELFSLTQVSPLFLKFGDDATELAAGGVTAESNMCATAGDLLVTTNDTGEVYNPGNDSWTSVSNPMSAKRAAHSASLLLYGPLAGESLIAGGIDFEAGTFPSSCVASTSLTQTTTASADLFNPASTASGAFAATGSLNQARGGQGFGLEGLFPSDGAPPATVDGIVVGGECAVGTAASYIIGTAAATSSCGADAQSDYSETFDQMSQTWSLGPGAPASGVLPANGPVSATSP